MCNEATSVCNKAAAISGNDAPYGDAYLRAGDASMSEQRIFQEKFATFVKKILQMISIIIVPLITLNNHCNLGTDPPSRRDDGTSRSAYGKRYRARSRLAGRTMLKN